MAPPVVQYCRDLLRIDSTNPDSNEAQAADYVVRVLDHVGVKTTVVEPAPGRCSVISTVRGAHPELEPLIVHGHLDVVPPQSSGWSHDPFAGDEADACLWGRGAVDMKDFVAMMLDLQVRYAQGSERPRRDLIFAYFADEEMGGAQGSRWIVENRPDLFQRARTAVGEVGGFRVTLPNGRRIYPLQSAERGMLWFRLRIPGRTGHSALTRGPNPIVRAARVIEEVASLALEETPPQAFTLLLEHMRDRLGADGQDDRALLQSLGSFGTMAEQGAKTTFTPTVIHAGGKTNIIPDHAEVMVDCRFLPGQEAQARAAIAGVLEPDMTSEVTAWGPGLLADAAGPFAAACRDAVSAHDPGAEIIPFVLAAGTDAQHLSRLGIEGYGFCPLVLPATFDYAAAFHAPDERVPIDALTRGNEILRDVVSRF